MPVDHWMTFGTFAEQRYFTYPNQDTYAGVIINANMVAHAPSGLAAFLLEKTRSEFPYLIDPLTHAFQHDVSILLVDKDRVKSSIKNLAASYGELINSKVGIESLYPSDFDDGKNIKELVENCLFFQEETLTKAIRDRDSFKYLQEFGEQENSPYGLVAPYFYMDEFTIDEWLPINIQCADYATKIKKEADVKIFSAVVINQGILLETELVDKIISSLSDLDVSGFLFWVDNLDETNTNRSVIKGFLRLARGLRAGGKKEVINLHGGYFSVLASSTEFGESAFSGVSHGPEFGEFRPIIPVGGGIPVAKYYIKQLHTRVDYKQALRYFKSKGWLNSTDEFYRYVCACDECRSVMLNDPANFTIFGESTTKLIKRGTSMVSREFSLKETKEHCLKHYLNRKREEYETVSKANRNDLLNELRESEEEFIAVAGREAVAHLNLWYQALK